MLLSLTYSKPSSLCSPSFIARLAFSLYTHSRIFTFYSTNRRLRLFFYAMNSRHPFFHHCDCDIIIDSWYSRGNITIVTLHITHKKRHTHTHTHTLYSINLNNCQQLRYEKMKRKANEKW